MDVSESYYPIRSLLVRKPESAVQQYGFRIVSYTLFGVLSVFLLIAFWEASIPGVWIVCSYMLLLLAMYALARGGYRHLASMLLCMSPPFLVVVGSFWGARLGYNRLGPLIFYLLQGALILMAILPFLFFPEQRHQRWFWLALQPALWLFVLLVPICMLLGIDLMAMPYTAGKDLLLRVVLWLLMFMTLGGFMWLNRNRWAQERQLREYSRTLEQRIEARTLELQRAKRQAEEANTAKTYFLSTLSHEIRTSLNAIVGFTQLMQTKLRQQEGQDPDLTFFAEGIQLGSRNLLDLINNILDLSKIEAGKMQLHAEEIALKQLLQSVYHLYKANAYERGVCFNYSWDGRLPEHIVSDRTRLIQILTNLVSNALKFTPEGREVRLSAYLTAATQLRLEVMDEGIGIPASQLQQIFRPFEQVRGLQGEGTGLGLSICQGMAHLLGGELQVESLPGKGSRFWLDMPLLSVPAPKPLQTPAALADLDGLQVLVVDYQQTNLILLHHLMEFYHFEGYFASDAQEGLLMARRYLPDVVLIDPRIEGMPLPELLRQLRRIPELMVVPIVAISSDAFVERQQQVLEAGFTAFLSKPIDYQALLSILQASIPSLRVSS